MFNELAKQNLVQLQVALHPYSDSVDRIATARHADLLCM